MTSVTAVAAAVALSLSSSAIAVVWQKNFATNYWKFGVIFNRGIFLFDRKFGCEKRCRCVKVSEISLSIFLGDSACCVPK